MKGHLAKKGLFFAILAPLLYALKAATLKFAPPLKVEQVVLSRYLFDFVILAPLYLKSRSQLTSQKKPLYALRACCSFLTGCCSLYGIRHLALADAMLLENTMPLFIPLVLWIWNREKIGPISWLLLCIGFSSLFFLLKPELNVLQVASIASLMTGLLSAILTVSIRQLSTTESPLMMYFHFNLFAGLLAIVFCTVTWEGMPQLSPNDLFFLLLNSLIGMTFQYMIIRAYSLIAPHLVGCMAYFGILFSSILGWLIWEESLSPSHLIGGVALISAGILMILYQRRQAYPHISSKLS
jgi:drug/metabolite transporter (DMT)-like permease